MLAIVGRHGGICADPTLYERFRDGAEGEVLFRAASLRCPTLTDREREVLILLAKGLSDAETARQMGIASGTVRWHVGQLREKLNANTRAHLIDVARTQGLLDD